MITPEPAATSASTSDGIHVIARREAWDEWAYDHDALGNARQHAAFFAGWNAATDHERAAQEALAGPGGRARGMSRVTWVVLLGPEPESRALVTFETLEEAKAWADRKYPVLAEDHEFVQYFKPQYREAHRNWSSGGRRSQRICVDEDGAWSDVVVEGVPRG